MLLKMSRIVFLYGLIVGSVLSTGCQGNNDAQKITRYSIDRRAMNNGELFLHSCNNEWMVLEFVGYRFLSDATPLMDEDGDIASFITSDQVTDSRPIEESTCIIANVVSHSYANIAKAQAELERIKKLDDNDKEQVNNDFTIILRVNKKGQIKQ